MGERSVVVVADVADDVGYGYSGDYAESVAAVVAVADGDAAIPVVCGIADRNRECRDSSGMDRYSLLF